MILDYIILGNTPNDFKNVLAVNRLWRHTSRGLIIKKGIVYHTRTESQHFRAEVKFMYQKFPLGSPLPFSVANVNQANPLAIKFLRKYNTSIVKYIFSSHQDGVPPDDLSYPSLEILEFSGDASAKSFRSLTTLVANSPQLKHLKCVFTESDRAIPFDARIDLPMTLKSFSLNTFHVKALGMFIRRSVPVPMLTNLAIMYKTEDLDPPELLSAAGKTINFVLRRAATSLETFTLTGSRLKELGIVISKRILALNKCSCLLTDMDYVDLVTPTEPPFTH